MVVGSLGDIVFEVSAERVMLITAFSLNQGVKFADHEVQGTFPASEYVAPELSTVRFSLNLRRDLGCDPVAEAERLDAYMLDGFVVRLIIAGRNLGKFTIRSVDQSWRHMIKGVDGPLGITLDVTLKRYF